MQSNHPHTFKKCTFSNYFMGKVPIKIIHVFFLFCKIFGGNEAIIFLSEKVHLYKSKPGGSAAVVSHCTALE